MASKMGQYFLVCALVALSLTFHIEATVTKTSNFDNYATIISKMTNITDRLTVFRAVWGEIRADDAENMDKTKTFYDNLLLYTKNAVNADLEEASEIIEEVRNALVIGNGGLLAETLNNDVVANVAAVTEFRTKLLAKYTGDLLDAIFANAIDTIYPFKNTTDLHAELEAIDTRLTTLPAFQTNVHWNLYLYYKFLQRGDIDDLYLYAVARSLHNIQLNTWYTSLSRNTARHVSAALATLPISLNTLFSKATICLSNTNFLNYYLYFKDPATTTAWNSVQAVVSNSHLQHSSWMNSFSNSVLVSTSTIFFRTQPKAYYLSRRTSDNSVNIEKVDPTAATRQWAPIFREGKILLAQNNFYLCATAVYDNLLLGFIVKAVSGISFDDPKCQWVVTDCSELK